MFIMFIFIVYAIKLVNIKVIILISLMIFLRNSEKCLIFFGILAGRLRHHEAAAEPEKRVSALYITD